MQIKKYALPLQPLSEINALSAQRFLKIIFEKVSEKFGAFKNLPYLCTTFRSEIESKSDTKRFFELLVLLRENCSIYLSISFIRIDKQSGL